MNDPDMRRAAARKNAVLASWVASIRAPPIGGPNMAATPQIKAMMLNPEVRSSRPRRSTRMVVVMVGRADRWKPKSIMKMMKERRLEQK